MSDEPTFTYYTQVEDNGGEPCGLIRRAEGRRDEAFLRDLTWQTSVSDWLRKSELGYSNQDFREVPADEAQALIQRWTKKWAEEDRGQVP